MRTTVGLLASLVTAVLVASVVLVTAIGSARPVAAAQRPNILFVMTDDQPIKDTMSAMPEVRERVRDKGLTLPNAYVSQSLCCPSRASVLRGQYPHNTGVVKNAGLRTFRARGEEDNTVAHWLGRQGYSRALVGRYMNGYDASYTPSGWSYWYAKAEASTPGRKVRENGRVIDFAGKPGNWGDRFKGKALGYLDRSTDQASDRPFALFFWTSQPHLPAGSYAGRYSGMYKNAALPRVPSYNEKNVRDKPKWVRNLGRIGDRERARLRQ